MRELGSVVLTLAAGYALLLAAVWLFQPRLIYFPQMDRDAADTPARLGLPFETLRIATADGETLSAWYVPACEARGVALFFHGNAGSIAHRLDWLPLFRRLRLDTLLVDYRGYGASSGKPSEQGTYRDAEAAWRQLTETRGVAPARIAVFGESLGGAVAAWLAAGRRPGALVLMSSFTSVPELAAGLYPWLPARWLSRYDYDTRARLADVASPVLVAHSPQDDIIPYAHGERLFAAAREPKRFLTLAGGHNTGFIFAREDWAAELGAFLDAHLPAAPASGDGLRC